MNIKLEMIFDEIENRKPVVAESNGMILTSITSNGIWNTETKKVDWIEKIKLFGITIKTKVTEIPVDVFFEKMKKSKKQLQIIDGMIEKYTSRIEKAQKFGQVALVEQMKDQIEVTKKETLALVGGVKEYLTQEQVEKLLTKTSKHIEVDYIKNFSRHIPDNLLDLKTKLDGVFDDYVVMHYDPKKKNTELTKKEKEKKRDPILFGIIKNSRNFYYIGDWIDEYCNLTLKDAVAIIEDKPKQL